MLIEKEAVKKRWAEYFEGLLNLIVERDREAEIVVDGRENRGGVGGEEEEDEEKEKEEEEKENGCYLA